MYIRACRQILVHYSKRFFKENFLDTVLPIENDPVLSVSHFHRRSIELNRSSLGSHSIDSSID